MMYSEKIRLDRRNSVVAAAKKELKANNAYVAPEVLQALAEKIDTGVYYNIEVLKTAEAAAKRLQLKDSDINLDLCGERTESEVENGQVVFGKVEFGENYYRDQGRPEDIVERVTDADFELNGAFCVLIEHHKDYDDAEGSRIHRWVDTIVIYTPEKILDEGGFIAQKEKELEKLCDLRA